MKTLKRILDGMAIAGFGILIFTITVFAVNYADKHYEFIWDLPIGLAIPGLFLGGSLAVFGYIGGAVMFIAGILTMFDDLEGEVEQ